MLGTWKKRMTWQGSWGRYKPLTAFYSGKVSLKEMPGHTQFWSRYPNTGGSSRKRMRMPLLTKESASSHIWWCRRCCSGEVQTSNSSLERISVLEHSLVDVFNTGGSIQTLVQGSTQEVPWKKLTRRYTGIQAGVLNVDSGKVKANNFLSWHL